jgi:hypothetical protein
VKENGRWLLASYHISLNARDRAFFYCAFQVEEVV